MYEWPCSHVRMVVKSELVPTLSIDSFTHTQTQKCAAWKLKSDGPHPLATWDNL